MRWLNGINDLMDMSLRMLQEIVKDRGAWQATVHGVERVGHDLETKPLSPPFFITPQTISYLNISHTYYAK